MFLLGVLYTFWNDQELVLPWYLKRIKKKNALIKICFLFNLRLVIKCSEHNWSPANAGSCCFQTRLPPSPPWCQCYFTLLPYLCGDTLSYLCTGTAWAPQRAGPRPLGWALPAAAAVGTAWHSHQSHPSGMQCVHPLQCLALISNETEKPPKHGTSLCQFTKVNTEPEDPSPYSTFFKTQDLFSSRIIFKIIRNSYVLDLLFHILGHTWIRTQVSSWIQVRSGTSEQGRNELHWTHISAHSRNILTLWRRDRWDQIPQTLPCKGRAKSAAQKYFKALYYFKFHFSHSLSSGKTFNWGAVRHPYLTAYCVLPSPQKPLYVCCWKFGSSQN